MKMLYFTADDFGISPEINSGILDCCVNGPVRNVSITVNFEHFRPELLFGCSPDISYGLHFTLTEGTPAARVGQVSSLLDSNGLFYKNHLSLFMAILLGKVKPREIELELDCQIQKYLSKKIPLDFINSHEHIHMHPLILRSVIKACRRYGIPRMRFARERSSFDNKIGLISGREFKTRFERRCLGVLARWEKKVVDKEGLALTDYFAELAWGGSSESCNYEQLVSWIISRENSSEVWEICCHPTKATNAFSPSKTDRVAESAFLTNPRLAEMLYDQGVKILTARQTNVSF